MVLTGAFSWNLLCPLGRAVCWLPLRLLLGCNYEISDGVSATRLQRDELFRMPCEGLMWVQPGGSLSMLRVYNGRHN